MKNELRLLSFLLYWKRFPSIRQFANEKTVRPVWSSAIKHPGLTLSPDRELVEAEVPCLLWRPAGARGFPGHGLWARERVLHTLSLRLLAACARTTPF